jgi:GAF domain-containing protein
MSPDQMKGPLDALQAQLRDALEAHASALTQQYDQALADAKRDAAAEAKRDAAAEAERAAALRIETLKSELRAEWTARLEKEVAAARAEAERRLVAETMKARVEAEQQAAESTSGLREELEHALAAERQRAEAQLLEERRRGEAAIANERERGAAEIASVRTEAARAAETAAAAARAAIPETPPAPASPPSLERLLDGLRTIDRAQTLTQVLDALLKEAARSAPRAIAFLVSGDRVRGWKAAGFEPLDPQQIDNPITGTGLLAAAAKTGEPVTSGQDRPAPSFAALPADRVGLAIPLVVGGHTVAVLYADNAGADETAGWAETIQVLARHAAAALSLVTALRTLQTLTRGNGPADGAEADDQGAKRYARLLVSEIKLYNEGAVRVGRQKRDLLQRLGPEIERARRLYEQRIPADVPARATYFQQELVQTLADGDAALLGNA